MRHLKRCSPPPNHIRCVMCSLLAPHILSGPFIGDTIYRKHMSNFLGQGTFFFFVELCANVRRSFQRPSPINRHFKN